MFLNYGVGDNSWELLELKDIKPVNPKRNQSLIFVGRTDVEAETPILWPTADSWLIGKDPDAGKDWRHEKKGLKEDEVVGWHHWFDGHEIEQALGVGDGQETLACYCPRGHKESDTTERLNWTDLIYKINKDLLYSTGNYIQYLVNLQWKRIRRYVYELYIYK